MNEMWMLPSYRTRRWAYIQLPKVGDGIRYMNDGFDVYVQAVRPGYLLFTDGTVMRRRVDWGMITAWIGKHNWLRNVSSWRSAKRRRETWVDAGMVLYNA